MYNYLSLREQPLPHAEPTDTRHEQTPCLTIEISTVGVAEVNLCFYCTALTRIHSIHTVRAEGSLVRSDSGLELVQALLPAGRLQAADRRLI